MAPPPHRKLLVSTPALLVAVLLPWLYIAYDLARDCHAPRPAAEHTPSDQPPSSSTTPPPPSATTPPFVPFETIVSEGTSDKRTHHYGAFYGVYLDRIRQHAGEVHLLEIGLKYGDSLKLWKRAFPQGRIWGVDNGAISKKYQAHGRDSRITLLNGDQANATFLEELVARIKEEVGLLDFIVDDGGHTMQQQITSFTHLMPLVKPGGMYFIEDVETSYYTYCHVTGCYGGGPPGKNDTTIAMLKSFVDVINRGFFEKQPYAKGLQLPPHYVNPSEKLVGAVHCMRNLCALRRKSTEWY